jgi:hypothetical protein
LNKIGDKIKTKLQEEFIERSMSITDSQLNKMVESVLLGNFNFRIIYDDAIMGDFQYLFEEFKVIDNGNFKISRTDSGDHLISIDRGVRFQWGKNEIITIDRDLIREWKLNLIL